MRATQTSTSSATVRLFSRWRRSTEKIALSSVVFVRVTFFHNESLTLCHSKMRYGNIFFSLVKGVVPYVLS